MRLPGFLNRFKHNTDSSEEEGVVEFLPENSHDSDSEPESSPQPESSREPAAETGSSPIENMTDRPSGTEAAAHEAPPASSIRREPDSVESLWFSLVDNPNNEKNLNILIRYCQTRKGPEAVRAALAELAMGENSYMPQLMLASRALERKEIKEALQLYDELVSRGITNDYTLMRMSADLGRHGHPTEVIRLTLPCYIPEKHNAYIGLNILQACRESGNVSEGRSIWTTLRTINSPGITKALDGFSPIFGPGKSTVAETEPSEKQVDREEDHTVAPVDIEQVPASIDRSNIMKDANVSPERPRILDVPVWKFWLSSVKEILPNPETAHRVGIFLYSDTSAVKAGNDSKATQTVAAGLPILIGEKLLFSAPVTPIVLFPVSSSKGPDFGVAEPDIEGLFALCAKESLSFLVAGTVDFNGQNRAIRTWILDRAKQTARVLSLNSGPANFGEALTSHIHEIVESFAVKNYAFEAKRKGFSYSHPNAATIEAHLDALMHLGLRWLVDSGLCGADILCPGNEFLDSLAQLCRKKPFSQNYLMMLLAGLVSDRENGGESDVVYRDLLYDMSQKLQYTPCVTSARKIIDQVLNR